MALAVQRRRQRRQYIATSLGLLAILLSAKGSLYYIVLRAVRGLSKLLLTFLTRTEQFFTRSRRRRTCPRIHKSQNAGQPPPSSPPPGQQPAMGAAGSEATAAAAAGRHPTTAAMAKGAAAQSLSASQAPRDGSKGGQLGKPSRWLEYPWKHCGQYYTCLRSASSGSMVLPSECGACSWSWCCSRVPASAGAAPRHQTVNPADNTAPPSRPESTHPPQRA